MIGVFIGIHVSILNQHYNAVHKVMSAVSNLIHNFEQALHLEVKPVGSSLVVPVVLCESFRNFVMCLHGLDILSTLVLFFSLLFSLGQGSRSFCHELYGQSTVMFCRSGRDACF